MIDYIAKRIFQMKFPKGLSFFCTLFAMVFMASNLQGEDKELNYLMDLPLVFSTLKKKEDNALVKVYVKEIKQKMKAKKYQVALIYMKALYEMVNEIDVRGKALLYIKMGLCYQSIGDHLGAFYFLHHAFEILTQKRGQIEEIKEETLGKITELIGVHCAHLGLYHFSLWFFTLARTTYKSAIFLEDAWQRRLEGFIAEIKDKIKESSSPNGKDTFVDRIILESRIKNQPSRQKIIQTLFAFFGGLLICSILGPSLFRSFSNVVGVAEIGKLIFLIVGALGLAGGGLNLFALLENFRLPKKGMLICRSHFITYPIFLKVGTGQRGKIEEAMFYDEIELYRGFGGSKKDGKIQHIILQYRKGDGEEITWEVYKDNFEEPLQFDFFYFFLFCLEQDKHQSTS